MTVKTRGIRLKEHLGPEDQGQRKLIQVTYSQLAALHPAVAEGSAGRHPAPSQSRSPTTTVKRRAPSDARRRAIARMLRIELEATMAFLDQALDDMAGNETPEK